MAHINDLVDVLEGIDDKDPEWKNPLFVKSLKQALNYGFRLHDADVVFLKWKMIGNDYERPDNQDRLKMSKIDYQSTRILSWIIDQQDKMKTKDAAEKYVVSRPMSKEEGIGRSLWGGGPE